MKYYIISGEASGDLHGGNLIHALRKQDTSAEIRAWGGERMQQAGASLVKHYKELAFMGFWEVLINIRTIFKNLHFAKKDIEAFKPDVVILIDYPGFNLRIATWAKKQGFKVIYYISPQVWAWKENRVKTIKSCVDRMLVILPFEKAFYKKWDMEVDYVGHPLMEAIDQFQSSHSEVDELLHSKKMIAILPGSRKQEILKKLPIMLSVVKDFPDYDWVVAKAPGLDHSVYQALEEEYPTVKFISGKTYALLNMATAALVTSGTATLETALFGVPQIICYKGNPISYEIAKRLIKIKYIGLVNLIMDKPVVKELIQGELTAIRISEELKLILEDKKTQDRIHHDYLELKSRLQEKETASSKAASIIINTIR